MMDYEYTDKVIAYIDKQLIERYSRLKSLVSFDELNVLQEVNALYREIDIIVRKAFLDLANKVYRENVHRAIRSLAALMNLPTKEPFAPGVSLIDGAAVVKKVVEKVDDLALAGQTEPDESELIAEEIKKAIEEVKGENDG